ncbi:MAG: histidine kinase [Saprospiraceae bacterium]|nr:histidine kinase [Saprospiraceae bacterium]
MTRRISIRNKLLWAFGLNTFFYFVTLYVNLDGAFRSGEAIFGALFPLLALEYVVGSLMVFGWLFLAEYVHEWFERRFGEDVISRGSFWPNLAAVSVCAVANIAANYVTLTSIFWLQSRLFDAPDYSLVVEDGYSLMSIRFNYANYVILALFVYYLLIHRRIMQRAGVAGLRAENGEKEKAETQYVLLRNRVNPHFLFNSLSSLASLVQADGDCSEQFIDRLSKAYRYMLENRDRQTVSLREELGFLEAYSFVQKARFVDKLRLRVNLPPDVADKAQMLPLTLQMLVERAMKSNRMSVRFPLEIMIDVVDDELRIFYNRQPRLEPDGAIGDWSRTVLEDRYAALLPEGRTLREMAVDGYCTIYVPLWYAADDATTRVA